jgi:mycothiol system anti-sigma-R factor
VIAGVGEVSGSDGCSGEADCDEAVHRLYHYLDGELTEERRLEIAAHLDRCAPCAGAADFEAELRQIIADRCRDHVPESLVHRIATAIDEEQRLHGEPSATPPAATSDRASG